MSEALALPVARFMEPCGHFVLEWDPASDDKAEKLITEKMRQGIVFRVMGRPTAFRQEPALEVLRSVADVPVERKVVIQDAEIEQFVRHGFGRIVEEGESAAIDQEDRPPMRRARSAREVLENDTLAHGPLSGG